MIVAYFMRGAQKLPLWQMRGCVCLILFAVAVGRGEVRSVRERESTESESEEMLSHLDAAKPSITQPLKSGEGSLEGVQFVQVEITEVRNPKKVSLAFQVYFQSKSKEKVYLGSFSLYPSDNPGKFIVPTQGKLKEKGAVVLSMVMQDGAPPRDDIRVTVKKMKLLRRSESAE